MFLRLSTAKLLDESMAENAGNSISEVQLLKFPPGPLKVNYRPLIYCTSPIFEYSTLSLHVLGFGAVIHFL